jgi:hypothetical protein
MKRYVLQVSVGVVLTVLAVGVFPGFMPGGVKKAVAQQVGSTVFTCPMHDNVISDLPGNCPLCGMKLKPFEAEKNLEPEPSQKTYQCPMKCESDKTYPQPGTCPKCSMKLEEKSSGSADRSPSTSSKSSKTDT